MTTQPPIEPTTPPEPPAEARSRWLGCWMVGAALILVVAFGIYLTYRVAQRAVDNAPDVVSSVADELTEKQEQQIDLNAVVTEVRELARLETAKMRVVHMSTIRQSYKYIPDAIAGDELTLVAEGEVIAGIDLREVTRDDAWIAEDGTLTIRLPRAKILVSRLDNRKTRVISRDTGVLRRGDIDLESKARENAERGMRNEALRKGILDTAQENAEERLAEFLMTLGARKIRFTGEERPAELETER